MEKVDITIIGAGVIGLAVAYILSDSKRDIFALEKNASFGQETSSRNSEVIHSGIYYPKSSLKSQTCLRGKDLLYNLCAEHKIPAKKLGKVLVSTNVQETEKLHSIYENAVACGITNLKFLTKRELSQLEPNIKAQESMLCPDTGIVDSHGLMAFLRQKAEERGVNFAFSVEVTNVKKKSSFYKISVKEPDGKIFTFKSAAVINCAGLSSDKIAEKVGIDISRSNYRLHYCKGQYFRIRNPKKFRITHLIYPPPTDVSLGIHITPDLAGGLRLGPDAEFVSDIDYNIDEKASKGFFESVKKYLLSLDEGDLTPDTAGIRPKLHGPEQVFSDFVIREESEKGFPNFINTIGIESPGLTSCLAIADIIKELIRKYDSA